MIKRKIALVGLLLSLLANACTSSVVDKVPNSLKNEVTEALKKAGENATALEEALEQAQGEQIAGMAYLIAYMPQCDLDTIGSKLLLDNVKWAYRAKEEFSWTKNLPDSIFLNEVLPYMNLTEPRDNWREDFYNRFAPLVKNCQTMEEAIWAVNTPIKEVLEVEYNVKRKRVDQSPYESMAQGMATCTGLSVLLVDAFRSVGIPARVAGTPLWTNKKGNHNWVEVWMDGKWYFTEYYPDALNKGWFLADAGKADATQPIHWIYAASYKPSDTHFGLVWARDSKQVHAANVTQRYIDLYQEQVAQSAQQEGVSVINVVLYADTDTSREDLRVAQQIELWTDGKKVNWGYSPSTKDDLNKFLKFSLKEEKNYLLKFLDGEGKEKTVELIAPKPDELIKLYLKE